MRPRNLLAWPAGSRPVRWSRRNKVQQAGGQLEMTDTRRPPAAEDRPLVPCGGSETLLSPASLPGFWRLLLAPPACGTAPPPPGVCRLFLEDGVRSAASFLLCEGRGRVASRAPWRASVSPVTAAGLAPSPLSRRTSPTSRARFPAMGSLAEAKRGRCLFARGGS